MTNKIIDTKIRHTTESGSNIFLLKKPPFAKSNEGISIPPCDARQSHSSYRVSVKMGELHCPLFSVDEMVAAREIEVGTCPLTHTTSAIV